MSRLDRSRSWTIGVAVCVLAALSFVSSVPARAGDGADAAVPFPPSTSWWLHLRTSAYGFQTQAFGDSVDAQDRLGAYQHVAGSVSGLASGRITVRFATRFADDLEIAERTTERSRLYTGLVEARLHERATVRLGRQFVQEGPSGLTLDGLHVSVRALRTAELRLWGGARAPLDRAYELGDADKDAALGSRVLFRPTRRLLLAGSYTYRERDDVVAERPLGLEATFTPGGRLWLKGRAAYDLELENLKRVEVQGRWRPRPDYPVVAVQFLNRRPSVDAASFFARFVDEARITMARTTVRYELPSEFGGELEYVGAYLEDGSSSRIGLAFLAPIGRLGYSVRLGDAGEQSRLYGDVGVMPLTWLSLEGGAVLETYTLFDDAPEDDERDLTTLYGRARASLRPGLRLLLEVQSVENPFYSEDVRVLAGLDLTMGRGASRFGLDRGGWLR